jgi:hypothetical protein
MLRRKKPVAVKICFWSLSFFLLFGCGYGFAPQGQYIDKRIKNLYVEPFGNKTAQAEVENFLRTAFIDQIIQHSRFKAAPDIEQADAVIGGNVLNLRTEALSYRNNILAAEERMTITLEVSFREKENGRIIWSSRNVTRTADYKLQSNTDLQSARKQALSKLTHDTAETTFNLMMSDF